MAIRLRSPKTHVKYVMPLFVAKRAEVVKSIDAVLAMGMVVSLMVRMTDAVDGSVSEMEVVRFLKESEIPPVGCKIRHLVSGINDGKTVYEWTKWKPYRGEDDLP